MIFATSALLGLSLLAPVFGAPVLPRNNGGKPDIDVTVLKFAQVLEQLETEFYTQLNNKFTDADYTNAGFVGPAGPKQLFTAILNDESVHTEYLATALASVGESALDTCTFDFTSVLGDVSTAIAVARLIEQVGVGAYIGGAALITNDAYLVAAASILTIEARHQTALNLLNGGSTVSQPFDQGLLPAQVLSLAGPFISGCDLGIPANLPVVVSNTPTPGQALQFDLSAISDQSNLYCQMITAGAAEALVQPINNCVVPSDIPDGPVYVFITKAEYPLNPNVAVQDTQYIVAGPAIAFVDIVENELTKLIRTV